MTRAKICGLTRVADVQAAVSAGADLLGFVLADSSRKIDLSTLAELTAEVPPPVCRVAVFVNPKTDQVRAALKHVDRVQLHGSESPEFCALFPGRVIKALALRSPADLERVGAYAGSVTAFLFDTYSPHAAGGTGEAFNWDWLRGKRFPRPFFLAGGLRPENVAAAVERVRPWGVDVSSGVEVAPGVKSPEALQRFIENARG